MTLWMALPGVGRFSGSFGRTNPHELFHLSWGRQAENGHPIGAISVQNHIPGAVTDLCHLLGM